MFKNSEHLGMALVLWCHDIKKKKRVTLTLFAKKRQEGNLM